MEKKLSIVIAIIVLIAVAGGSYYLGTLSGTDKKMEFPRQNGAPTNMNGTNKLGQNNANSGEIISRDEQSITIKLTNGGSKIIFLSDSTKVSQIADRTIDDLQIGDNVIIQGTTNSDGTVTASTIQEKPFDQGQMPTEQLVAPQ